MSMTRNERRKAAKARFEAKWVRQSKAKLARGRQAMKDVIHANLQTKPERNFYPESSMSVMAGQSHRGYVCRASGNISKQGALSLSMRVKTQSGDRYARPVNTADRSNWPIKHD